MNNLITMNQDKPILQEDMVLKVVTIEEEMKRLKEIQDHYKAEIMEAMEEKGVIKLLDDISGLSITYIEAKENLEKFNQTKFREEHPDLYDEYVTLDGKKSAYITIRIK